MNIYSDIETVARHRITERTTPTRGLPRRPHRSRLATTLRRATTRVTT